MKRYFFLKDEYVSLLQQRCALGQKLQNMRCYRERESAMHAYHSWLDKRDACQREYDHLGRVLSRARVFANDILCVPRITSRRTQIRVGLGRYIALQTDNVVLKIMIGGYKTLPGRLSYACPLGRALMGKTVGSEVEVSCGEEKKRMKLLEIA